jgi:hypothetical protein
MLALNIYDATMLREKRSNTFEFRKHLAPSVACDAKARPQAQSRRG